MATPYTFFGNPLRGSTGPEAAADGQVSHPTVTALTRDVDMEKLEKELAISTNNETARLLQKSGKELTGTPISPVTQGLFGARANATPNPAHTNGNVIPLPASKQP